LSIKIFFQITQILKLNRQMLQEGCFVLRQSKATWFKFVGMVSTLFLVSFRSNFIALE